MDSRGKRKRWRDYTLRMNWIDIISNELPRLRLYASASLGSPAYGDLAVEDVLGAFFTSHMSAQPERIVLYRLLDLGIRNTSTLTGGEREELLKHVAGFAPAEAGEIVEWDPAQPRLRSAG